MPTKEQINALKSIIDDGTFDTLDQGTKDRLINEYGTTIRSFQTPQGTTKTVTTKLTGNRFDKFYPDVEMEVPETINSLDDFGRMSQVPTGKTKNVVTEGNAIELPKTQTRVTEFIPDQVNKPFDMWGFSSPEAQREFQNRGFDPLAEAANETMDEFALSNARATGLPLLAETVNPDYNFNEAFVGLTNEEVESIPAIQRLGMSLPTDVAMGEVGSKLVSKGIKSKPVQKFIAGQLKKRQSPVLEKMAEKSTKRLIQQYRNRQAQIATETLDQFVKANGGVTKKTAEKAISEGFPLEGGDVVSLKKSLNANKANMEAGQRGLLREGGMTEAERAKWFGEKFGFEPSIEQVGPPTKAVPFEGVQKTIKETADDIAQKSASGTPDMSGFQVRNPSELKGAPTKSKIANLNLDNVPANEEDLIGAIQAQFDINEPVLWEGRLLGKETLDRDTAVAMFDDLGLDPIKVLRSRDKGQAWNGVTSAGLRDYVQAKTEDVARMAQKVNVDDPKQFNAFIKEWMNHAASVSSLEGGTSEAARALAFAKNPKARSQKAIRDIFKAVKSEKDIKKVISFLKTVDPKDYRAINNFMENLKKGFWEKTGDAVYYTWINGILSGLKTQVRNISGNTITAVSAPIEKAASAAVSSLTPGPRARFFGEAPRHFYGMASSLKEGLQAFGKAFKSGQSSFGLAKYGIDGGKATSPIPGVAGDIIGVPGRMLVASDDFFKILSHRGALHSGAYRIASQKGLKGTAKAEFIADLIAHPTKELAKEAFDEAVYRTFTKDLGQYGKGLQKISYNVPAFKFVMPFVRTPINITKYGLERTPLGFLQLAKKTNRVAGVRDDIIAKAGLGSLATVGVGGGVTPLKDIIKGKYYRQSSEPDAKSLSVASFLNGGLAQLYAEGSITGAPPSDPELRKTFYASGKMPYSVKIGDRWVQYNLEPFGVTLGAMADMFSIWGEMEQEDAVVGVGLGMAKNFLNKSFMQGMSNFINAWSDPERYGQQFVNQLASSAVPYSSLLRDVGNVMDPTLRRPENAAQAFKGALPWNKEDVPPVYNIWGEEVKFQGGKIFRTLSPIRVNKVRADKATQEVDRLGAQPGSVIRIIGDVKMTSPTYYLAQQLRGQKAYDMISRRVAMDDWDKLIPSVQRGVLEKLFTRAGEYARKKTRASGLSSAANKILKGIKYAQERGDLQSEEQLKTNLRNIVAQDVIETRRPIK